MLLTTYPLFSSFWFIDEMGECVLPFQVLTDYQFLVMKIATFIWKQAYTIISFTEQWQFS